MLPAEADGAHAVVVQAGQLSRACGPTCLSAPRQDAPVSLLLPPPAPPAPPAPPILLHLLPLRPVLVSRPPFRQIPAAAAAASQPDRVQPSAPPPTQTSLNHIGKKWQALCVGDGMSPLPHPAQPSGPRPPRRRPPRPPARSLLTCSLRLDVQVAAPALEFRPHGRIRDHETRLLQRHSFEIKFEVLTRN